MSSEPMTRAPLRAGVLGLGMMGRHHARVLSNLPGVELVATADRDGDPHGAGAAAGVPVLDSLDDLLALGLDLVVVAVPTDDHARAAIRLAHEGVAALIEKPVAADLDSARAVVAAFRDSGVVGAVGHVERFNPALQQLRARLARGDLGAVYQVSTRRQGPFPDRIRDVGVVKDLATHDIDLTAWVAGSPFVSVMAHTANRTGREHEDLVTALGVLENGAVTNHIVNWLSPVKDRKVVVLGEGGIYEADTLSADLTHYMNGSTPTEWDTLSSFRGVTEGDVVRFAIPKFEPLAVQASTFCAAVRGEDVEICTLEEGLRTLQVAESVLRSAGDGSVVRVEPLG